MTYAECSNEIRNGKNHLLILGGSGSGKSHLIKQITSSDNTLRLAPTGLAALNIDGETIHSLFEFEPSIVISKNRVLSYKKAQLIKAADTIIIDEISMVRADVLDEIDVVLRNYHCRFKPFGGIRIIMVGDIFQLSPVVSKELLPYLKKMYCIPDDSFMFFYSNAFLNKDFLNNLNVLELNSYFRQKDELFLTILKTIRLGFYAEYGMDILNACYNKVATADALILTTTLKNANTINIGKFKLLPDTEHIALPSFFSKYLTHGKMLEDDIIQNCPMSRPLHLKMGMRVMFIKNDTNNKLRRWVNGSIGTLIGKKFASPYCVESLIIMLDNGLTVEVFRDRQSIIRPYFNEMTGKINLTEIASVENFPVIMAWAVSIHKSQGLTLPNAVVDLESGAFAAGQTYVALSRVRSLDTLYLSRPVQKKDIFVNKAASFFYTTLKNLDKIVDVIE